MPSWHCERSGAGPARSRRRSSASDDVDARLRDRRRGDLRRRASARRRAVPHGDRRRRRRRHVLPGAGIATRSWQASRDERVSDDGVRSRSSRHPPPLARAPARLRSPRSTHSSSEPGLAYLAVPAGWAVDFYAGSITRPHSDVDIAIWLDDLPRIAALPRGGRLAPCTGARRGPADGYERAGVRLELTFLVRGDDGRVVTPLRAFEAVWPDGAFGDAVGELEGVSAQPDRARGAHSWKSSAARGSRRGARAIGPDFDVLSGLGGAR